MTESTLLDVNGNPAKPAEVLITDRPDILQTIVDGTANALKPYGGVSPGGETLIFVGLVLGYAKPDPETHAIKKFAVTSFAANYTSIKASALYDSAARQAAMAEDKISSEAQRNKRKDSAKVHDAM